MFQIKFFLRLGLGLLHFLFIKFDLLRLTQSESSGYWLIRTYFKFWKKGIAQLPFALGRTSRGVRFNTEQISLDGYLEAVSSLFHSGSLCCTDILYNRYLLESNLKAKDVNDSKYYLENSFLEIWAICWPWEATSPSEKHNTYLKSLALNRVENGISADQLKGREYELTDTSLFAMAVSHTKQFERLKISIAADGYKPQRPHPSVYILRNGKQWCWLMAGEGNHRAYLLNAYDEHHLIAQIKNIVDIEDVAKWPNVKNSVYTEEEAVKIFKEVFDGANCMRGLI